MKAMDSVAADINRPGTASDRKTSTIGSTATGAAAGLTIGLCHWLLLDCMAGGHWHYVPPDSHLLSIGAPILVLPLGLWFGRVLSLIGTIITNRLQRDAGTAE